MLVQSSLHDCCHHLPTMSMLRWLTVWDLILQKFLMMFSLIFYGRLLETSFTTATWIQPLWPLMASTLSMCQQEGSFMSTSVATWDLWQRCSSMLLQISCLRARMHIWRRWTTTYHRPMRNSGEKFTDRKLCVVFLVQMFCRDFLSTCFLSSGQYSSLSIGKSTKTT